MCGDSYFISEILEFPIGNLREEIELRKNNENQYFEESELWVILNSTINGLAYLEKLGYPL